MGKAMLTIMGAFAQLERDTMLERTRAGLAAAVANGRVGGRPRKADDADIGKARQLRDNGMAATDIAKMLAVSRATAFRLIPVKFLYVRFGHRTVLTRGICVGPRRGPVNWLVRTIAGRVAHSR